LDCAASVRSRRTEEAGINGNSFFHWKSSIYELFVRPSGATHEDPEVGSVLPQLTIHKIGFEKDFEKIRNAEMGISWKKNALGEPYLRLRKL
jgi:hypothetical protein